jgi:hypothetical protein
LWGGLIGELRQAGLLDLFTAFNRDKDFELAVSKELWRLTDTAGEASGNARAAKAAEIIGKYQEQARLMQNKEGAFIRKLAGWIVRQSHDAYKLSHAAERGVREGGFFRRMRGGTPADFKAWRDFIRPKLHDRTFVEMDIDPANVKATNKFLEQVWRNLVSGNHTVAHGAGDWLGGFKGPGNLAKKVSAERELHFKGAKDWHDYNERFGSGSLFDTILAGLRHSARNTALMRVWGTNPRAAFDADIDMLAREARDRMDFDMERKLTGKGLKNFTTKAYFDAVSGELDRADAPTFARLAAGYRVVQMVSKLGFQTISSIPDIAIRASTLRHHGIGYLDTVGNGLESLGPGFTSGQKREMFDYLNVGTDAVIGSLFAQFSATDGPPGVMSKMLNVFFKANLATFWTDRQKAGVAAIMARNLAVESPKAWNALPADLQLNLRRHGIDAEQWEVIRASGTRNLDDKDYLFGDGLDAIDDAALLPLVRERLAGIEERLAEREAGRHARDAREAEWVAKRTAKLGSKLLAATARLDARVAKLGTTEAAELRKRMVRLGARLSELSEEFERRMDIGRPFTRGARRMGQKEGRIVEKMIGLDREIARVGREAKRQGKALGADFTNLFQRRFKELQDFSAEMLRRNKERTAASAGDVKRHGARIQAAYDDAREELSLALRSYFTDTVNEAMTLGGAREHALTSVGERRGTIKGEAIRAVMQFKRFPVTFITRHFAREFKRKGTPDYWGLAGLIAGTTALGYISNTTRELALGRNPRKIESLEDAKNIMVASMMKGGGLGIYGDFLFGQYNMHGGGGIETLLGPGIGQASQALRIFGGLREGEDQSLETYRLIQGNLPFVNLFYTRLALDYLVLWHMQEALSPGWAKRLETRVKKDNAATFWLRPTAAVR